MEPVHLGAIFREDILKEMDVSITKAAAGLDVGRKQLSKIVNEYASISVEMAFHLEQAFGVKAKFWLNRQKNMMYGT